jgi:RNA polymerase sigma-70 factor (ECF subfamily)
VVLEHPSHVITAAESDTELGLLARAGDVQALAALLELCRPSLYATAMGLLSNRADALDAVQDTCVVALLRLGDLRDGAAARGWLHRVVRNICLMRLRQRREMATLDVEMSEAVPGPEQALEQHALRDWVWQALDQLSADERVSLMLRHFTRCSSYEAIAQITAVPIGTVRSRLSRARSRLAESLLASVAGTPLSHLELIDRQRKNWEEFYRSVHARPVPRTYQELFTADVDVHDSVGHWHGIEAWSAEEREAISVGVRATILDVLASSDVTVLEIDFSNPLEWPNHCPPQATFVHRLRHGRSGQLLIHYPHNIRPRV